MICGLHSRRQPEEPDWHVGASVSPRAARARGPRPGAGPAGASLRVSLRVSISLRLSGLSLVCQRARLATSSSLSRSFVNGRNPRS
jgi:hypothetical protein